MFPVPGDVGGTTRLGSPPGKKRAALESGFAKVMLDGRGPRHLELESSLAQLKAEERIFPQPQPARAEFWIEAGYTFKNAASERHVCADGRFWGDEIEVIGGCEPGRVNGLHPIASKMRRDRYVARYRVGSAGSQTLRKLDQPLRRRTNIIVGQDDNLPGGSGQPGIQRDRLSTLGLMKVDDGPQERVMPRDHLGCGVARTIIDHDQLDVEFAWSCDARQSRERLIECFGPIACTYKQGCQHVKNATQERGAVRRVCRSAGSVR